MYTVVPRFPSLISIIILPTESEENWNINELCNLIICFSQGHLNNETRSDTTGHLLVLESMWSREVPAQPTVNCRFTHSFLHLTSTSVSASLDITRGGLSLPSPYQSDLDDHQPYNNNIKIRGNVQCLLVKSSFDLVWHIWCHYYNLVDRY